MYPMVQRQRDQQHQKPNQTRNRAGLLEQQPTVSVISRGRFQQHDVLEPLQEVSVAQQELTDDDEEEQRLPKRPLHRRFFTYVREAWTGVKSALDSELEDLETPPRYRPDSLESLCRATRFTQDEIKRIYRGFKAECPTGVVREDTFKMIYAQFFPQGANTSQYAHYVFNTLDQDHSGLISFEDFVQNLSILSRGSLEEKLRWAFSLYDINGDGYITREEMTDIVSSVYDLMGKLAEPCIDEDTVKEKVDRIFQKMDKNQDGVVTLDEFLECCKTDKDISASMTVFDSSM
ncbi:Kv channel-interacting protein 1-like [Sitophilus oryzae]|uniref:Kv channel-interacting protein 1-like n=1 Tax=Sitophilus oryzae TaxID=7048 RepID=A0A6J2XC17_SITOR|nr:Kv channel-interacting protein 1-like [Sitophilus oryzae]